MSNTYDSDIWRETEGKYGTSWVANKDAIESELPELAKRIDWSPGAKYDDGAKYRYSVTFSDKYGYSLWRNEKKGSFRSGSVQQSIQDNQPRQYPSQQVLSAAKDYEELKEILIDMSNSQQLMLAALEQIKNKLGISNFEPASEASLEDTEN